MDGGWQTFFVFKSLDNNMVCSLGIGIYICKRNKCRTKFMAFKFCRVGSWGTLISNSQYVGRFLFFPKTSIFRRLGALFD